MLKSVNHFFWKPGKSGILKLSGKCQGKCRKSGTIFCLENLCSKGKFVVVVNLTTFWCIIDVSLATGF